MSKDEIILTEDQQIIHDDILKRIVDIVPNYKNYSKENRMFSIEGSAGMGKSVLTSFIVKSLVDDYKIHVSTPTHKSLGVLNDMLKKNDLRGQIDTTTIHSYLKLSPKEDYENGQLILEIIPDSKVKKVDVLLIDEASMVGKSLYNFIDDAMNRGLVKCIIWVSDKHQLDPVLDEINPIYNKDIHKYQLTKIIRQAEGNPIITLANKFRKCIEHKIYPENDTIIKSIEDMRCKEIEIYNNDNDFMNRYFNSEYKAVENLIVSYTNKYTNNLNKMIRNILIPDSDTYVLDEHLIFNTVHTKNKEVIHNNNETIKIKKIQKNYSDIYKMVYWDIEDYEGRYFKAVDINDWHIFDTEIQKLANAAMKEKDRNAKRIIWSEYFDLKNEYQKVSYTYACTVHKSQGSSVNEIFINLRELLRMRNTINDIDFLKLLYVAVTRTKFNAIFLI